MAAQDVIPAVLHRRRGPIAALAGVLVLLLVAGAAALVALRREDHHDDVVARATLAKAVFDVTAVGVATDHRVAVVLSVTSGTRAELVDAHVTGDGWEAVHNKSVGLVRTVDCKGDPPLPITAEAVVELHGQRRAVDLLTEPGLAEVVRRTGREACGDVDARRALVLKASGTVRVPGGLQLALVVTNRSAHLVTLKRVAVGQLHVRTSKPLPTVLRPHTTLRMIVVLDARGCGKTAPLVGVSIAGRGGPAYLTVASADLPQLAVRVRQERCR
ncbi:MAG: hypothetical protein ABR549_14450 [Mycobacteriales bacterium]